MKNRTGALLPSLQDASDAERAPLHRQVYARIRSAILSGTFAPGARLPSSRTLAMDLGLSRITVESAFSQLDAEGFVVRKVGAGSYVAPSLPDVVRPPRSAQRSTRSEIPARGSRGAGVLSARGRAIAGAAPEAEPVGVKVFQPCMPALDAFPQATWARLLSRRARHGHELLAYGEAAGYRPLRQAVAAYLRSARGVRCEWEQVVITTGAQQGLELASRLLIDPGDDVWHEEPGYIGARGVFLTAGANAVPVRVDADGLDVDAGIEAAPDARLAYVTPSHQFPLGATMSLARRLSLLAWADRANAWILEDDYDSEFRYAGRPFAAVQGLDTADRVIYVGTFNKVMFPSLRLAYVVTPPDLVDAMIAARALGDGHPPVQSQAALTDFIGDGHFGAHVRQMRALYEERRDALVGALRSSFDEERIGPVDAGMHLTVSLPRGTDDRAIAARAEQAGLGVDSLSRHYLGRSARGMLLGFTGSPPAEMRRGVRTLAGLLAR
jgi:GntR family transcriptional regulator/MocR family aminotransferase